MFGEVFSLEPNYWASNSFNGFRNLRPKKKKKLGGNRVQKWNEFICVLLKAIAPRFKRAFARATWKRHSCQAIQSSSSLANKCKWMNENLLPQFINAGFYIFIFAQLSFNFASFILHFMWMYTVQRLQWQAVRHAEMFWEIQLKTIDGWI